MSVLRGYAGHADHNSLLTLHTQVILVIVSGHCSSVVPAYATGTVRMRVLNHATSLFAEQPKSQHSAHLLFMSVLFSMHVHTCCRNVVDGVE